jgi:alpha-beta hydrolase superfamily lysophospholipase
LAERTLRSFAAGDGYVWQYRRYEPLGEPRTSVIQLHGIQSHGGWYGESCQALAAAGSAVSFLDRRGCGVNERDRGDAPSFRRLLDDVAEFMAEQPRPRILIGISWGGKLAVGLQRRHPGLTDGLVLIAPGLFQRIRPSLGERTRIFASRFLAPRRRFLIPLNEPDLFTANPERQQFIRTDPLALRDATARLLFESGRMDVYLRFVARHVSMPTLLFLAGKDRIIDNVATRRFVDRFQSADRTVIEYENAQHTLEFEPGGAPFVGDLLRWLDGHAPPAAAGGL